MKPLELRVYEKHPGDGQPVYRVGGSFTPYAIVATDKRFSVAELSAEYHCAEMGTWLEHFGIFKGPEEEYRKIHEAFARFAFLPHYDEDPQ